ncbi:MAG TPA: MmgE/PrpD family protein [Syntrophobacteraceae bacterium]|nr:MmgE/PrpD family protein [Syntrophobacteraceae bacterium]
MASTLSEKLADFIDSVRYEDLPGETVRSARLAFLDWLGSAARGGLEAPAKMAAAVLRNQGGAPQSTLLPYPEKTSCLNAALANGIASHIVELDDVHRGSILHAGAAILPAAFAAAEMVHADGRRLIEAVVAGYEVAVRLGEAVSPSHYFFWHNTGTCGTFGSCAAAGKLLGLDRRQKVWALGNAGTQAAGLWEFLRDGAMSKHLHPGKAAYNGLLAALLAKEGFTGAEAVIEGEKGFCRAMAPAFDLSKITEGLGAPPYKIQENSFKIHASCRHTHPAVDLVLDLSAKHGIDSREVLSVTVRTYRTALNIIRNPAPRTVFDARFSLPFCVALALKRGRCGLSDFTRENLLDSEIRTLMSRVHLEPDEELDALHPARWGAVVEIKTRSVGPFSARTDFPRGDPENPVDEETLVSKFRLLALPAWGQDKVNALSRTVLDLEDLEDTALLFDPASDRGPTRGFPAQSDRARRGSTETDARPEPKSSTPN